MSGPSLKQGTAPAVAGNETPGAHAKDGVAQGEARPRGARGHGSPRKSRPAELGASKVALEANAVWGCLTVLRQNTRVFPRHTARHALNSE